jgi:hypothetical protein
MCVRFHIITTVTLKITFFGYHTVSSAIYAPILGRMQFPHEDADSKCLPRVGCVFCQTLLCYVPKDAHIFVGSNLVMQWFCTVVIVKSLLSCALDIVAFKVSRSPWYFFFLVFSKLLAQTLHSTIKALLENRTVDVVEQILRLNSG